MVFRYAKDVKKNQIVNAFFQIIVRKQTSFICNELHALVDVPRCLCF